MVMVPNKNISRGKKYTEQESKHSQWCAELEKAGLGVLQTLPCHAIVLENWSGYPAQQSEEQQHS